MNKKSAPVPFKPTGILPDSGTAHEIITAAASLTKRLRGFEEKIAEGADHRAAQVTIGKEVKDYLATVNPRDEHAVSLIVVKEMQIKMLPGLIEGVEWRLAEQFGPALLEEIRSFPAKLQSRANAETGAAVDIIEAAIRPWFPATTDANGKPVNHARRAALGSPLADGKNEILPGYPNDVWAEPTRSRDQYDDPASPYDRVLIVRARTLLAAYQAWEAAGGTFLSGPLPPVPVPVTGIPGGTSAEAGQPSVIPGADQTRAGGEETT